MFANIWPQLHAMMEVMIFLNTWPQLHDGRVMIFANIQPELHDGRGSMNVYPGLEL